MQVISLRNNPNHLDKAIHFLQKAWPQTNPIIYQDCLTHCINASQHLPQWYLLEQNGQLIGCAGLITNDFISRMDLYPWLCALFIDENWRGKNLATMLINKAIADTKDMGYNYLYLCTNLIGYYEAMDFEFIGTGYHPWNATSRIYSKKL
jgi:N-acetylglutamate synthase-like GNAT family acetyltransferase